MPPKNNPLGLNPLQRKTLALLQALAVDPVAAEKEGSGEIRISRFPVIHGDHFHVGDALVMARDATGLGNEAVWKALERKGLAKAEFPHVIRLTPAGLAYDSGVGDEVLRRHVDGGH